MTPVVIVELHEQYLNLHAGLSFRYSGFTSSLNKVVKLCLQRAIVLLHVAEGVVQGLNDALLNDCIHLIQLG